MCTPYLPACLSAWKAPPPRRCWWSSNCLVVRDKKIVDVCAAAASAYQGDRARCVKGVICRWTLLTVGFGDRNAERVDGAAVVVLLEPICVRHAAALSGDLVQLGGSPRSWIRHKQASTRGCLRIETCLQRSRSGMAMKEKKQILTENFAVMTTQG